MNLKISNIRFNPQGDLPEIASTAFIDPSAQIIGNIHIGPDVYVGPNAVIRADEPDDAGRVSPVVIEEKCNIQDGVIIHALKGTSVRIGARTSISHGCIIHGPCVISPDCFLGFRAVIFNSTLEEFVWVGVGAIILESQIPSHVLIPAGLIVSSHDQINHQRIVREEELKFQKEVFETNQWLTKNYQIFFQKHKI